MEDPIVVMDDDFINSFSRLYAEKMAPAVNDLLNEQIRENKKYAYLAMWNGVLIGVSFTMIFTKWMMGAY